VLPVQVSEAFLAEIFETIKSNPGVLITVDLENQTVSLEGSSTVESFEINSYKKDNMKNGFDDIDYLLNLGDKIADFATERPF
jgi:3-isopropylmalate/(R)-2-methylmalate dehydratase small subunit